MDLLLLETSPSVFVIMPVRRDIVVVLPAPLCPRRLGEEGEWVSEEMIGK